MESAEVYEQKNVHEVYQQIAEHFSSTRYKVYIAPPSQIAGLMGFSSHGPSWNDFSRSSNPAPSVLMWAAVMENTSWSIKMFS
jgi:hypothetical protein